MESFTLVLPKMNESLLASRGPFEITSSFPSQSMTIVLRLPLWTSRETLKLFTELYMKASSAKVDENENPAVMLQKLVETSYPYEDAQLLKEQRADSAIAHWAVVPKDRSTQTLAELKDALAISLRNGKSVVFVYESKKAEVPIVHSGVVHKLGENSFILKSGWKYRNYSFEDVSQLSVISGRSAINGVPTLKLSDRKNAHGRVVILELSTTMPWTAE
jgi:hypothetical protein